MVDEVMEEKKLQSLALTFESLCKFFSNKDASGLLGLPTTASKVEQHTSFALSLPSPPLSFSNFTFTLSPSLVFSLNLTPTLSFYLVYFISQLAPPSLFSNLAPNLNLTTYLVYSTPSLLHAFALPLPLI